MASQNMANHLQANGYLLRIINRSINLRSSTALRYIIYSSFLFAKLLLARRFNCLMYVQLSGGYGQILDLLLIVIFSPFFRQIVIHHHSFSYVRQPRLLTGIIFSIPMSVVHVCQCDHMISLLKANYPRNSRAIYKRLSNVSFNSIPGLAKPRQTPSRGSTLSSTPISSNQLGCLRMGFISGPILEKGLDDSIALALTMIDNGIDVVLCLAGGSKADFNALIDSIVQDNQFDCSGLQIEHAGILSRDKIGDYISSLDCLLLPTRYKNEVEPLAILEAYSLGVPVIAKQIGCIGDILAPHWRISSELSSEQFLSCSVYFLIQLALDLQFRSSIHLECISHYQFLLSRSRSDLEIFDTMIADFFDGNHL